MRSCSWLCVASLALAGCNGSRPIGVAPAASSSASAAKTSAQPELQGTFRLQAMLALNARAEAELGAKRVDVLVRLVASADHTSLVSGRVSWIFRGQQLKIRFESVLRLEDGAFTWRRCEGQGAVQWQGPTLKVPSEIGTTGEFGTFTKDAARSGSCNCNVLAGTYQVLREGGELIVRTAADGAEYGLLLVADETELDIRGEAKRLAGNTQ